MDKRIYIIEYVTGNTHMISQEAYWDYNIAKHFIESRSDKPIMVTPYQFKSENAQYMIHDILVKG